MYLLILIILLLFSYILNKFIQFERKFGHLRKKFACVHWVVLKNLPHLMKIENALEYAYKLNNTYKQVSIFCLFPHCKLLVYERKLAELILNSNLEKSIEYSFLDVWLRRGLLTSNYREWKGQKRLLAPAFNIDYLQNHVKAFNEKAQILCDKLEKEISNHSIDIHYYIMLCTLDMILATAIDANINVQDNPNSSYLKNIRSICEVVYFRSMFSILPSFTYKFSPYYKKEQEIGKVLNDFSLKFIKEKRSGISTSATRTLLDIILENEEINDNDVQTQLNTFIFAGHDTTGITLSFALYALSKHPDVQEKVYQEILDVIGPDNEPTYNDLMSLPYMSIMLMEVSRLYPAVPLISRQITREIDWNGCTLPKGLSAYISIYTIHRDPDNFPDPEKFDPERFNDENRSKIPQFAYLPFSIGARNCIGQKFAQFEMKSVLVNVLRRYEILPSVPELKLRLTWFVTLQSFNGIKIGLKHRCVN